jgi:hypothetical protein
MIGLMIVIAALDYGAHLVGLDQAWIAIDLSSHKGIHSRVT